MYSQIRYALPTQLSNSYNIQTLSTAITARLYSMYKQKITVSNQNIENVLDAELQKQNGNKTMDDIFNAVVEHIVNDIDNEVQKEKMNRTLNIDVTQDSEKYGLQRGMNGIKLRTNRVANVGFDLRY